MSVKIPTQSWKKKTGTGVLSQSKSLAQGGKAFLVISHAVLSLAFCRGDVLSKLDGKEDGAFLVAQSISGDNNDYSLLFRQKGITRSIVIFHHSDGYSLSGYSMFQSVSDLVKNYKLMPLDGRNSRLNLTLCNSFRKVSARLL